MRFQHARLFARWLLVYLSLVVAVPVRSQEAPDADGLSEQEQQQLRIAERFLGMLEKNPRRGTALDRVYGHHVEFGSLDAFTQSLRTRVEQSPEDGTGWMLLGLIESHRGNDADAINSFQKAEQLRPDDALASYYLGQSQLLLGQPELAVVSFERAIDRQPPRADLLEIFQQLGRVHQRAQRSEEALKVWQRLEEMFPDDPRVQEQIAVTLVQEGEFGLALPRYEKLATLVRDDYRRTMFRIEAAELKIRENQHEQGLADFEKLLADLNPDSWLHRDVRRRIEDVFLRSGNQDGLVTYYEKWISTHPEDVDAMARLAKFLTSAARVKEAAVWMEKALKLAPGRTELRKAFIDQLVNEQRYTEASQQYKLLVEADPSSIDFLRDWGKLVLKDASLEPDERTREATRIWNMILAARPDDALTAAQVADLMRQSKLNDPALALYQKAVELAPNDPQYREYLGEFYHVLKRPDDALATWTSIAEGDRHTAVNVARLAEIYNSFGYLKEAVSQIATACRLDPKDFALHLKAADYHSRAGQFDEALSFTDAADKLAATIDEQNAVVEQRVEVLRTSQKLDEEIESLSTAVHADANASLQQWHLLARYCEADGRWNDADEAVQTALKRDPQSTSLLTTAARIAESSGDYSRAADINRQLANIDRRSRSDHLMNVARLEAQLGREAEALAAGKELIVAAPGNTDNYEFYARLCFQLRKTDEGIETLRKAVRINPTEPHLITALGAALSSDLRTDEAIEVYWRAFESTEELDEKTSLTMKLAELYQQTNQFDKLIERFDRDRREEDKRREMTICIAQAHHTAGDYGAARQELESLLSEDTRDTNLLQQLSKLCQDGGDLDAAIEYQRQLAEIAPGDETGFRLAGLLQARGDRDEAGELLLNLMRREEDPARRLRNLDSLLAQSDYENVIALVEPLLSEQRDDWELLYRDGVAWAYLDKAAEARDRFDRLLAMNIPHDELGVNAQERFKQAQAQARSNNLRGLRSAMPQRRSPLTLLASAAQVRQAVGLDGNQAHYLGMANVQSVWTPSAYGEARMAAYAWLMRLDKESAADISPTAEAATLETRFERLSAAAAAADASRETVYDWLYVEQLRENYSSIFRAARKFAKDGGLEERQFFLSSLTSRDYDARVVRTAQSTNGLPQRTPLVDEDLTLMLECYEALTANDSAQDLLTSGSQITYDTSGQAYIQSGGRWIPVGGLAGGGVYTSLIIEELKLAGRQAEAESFLQKLLANAKSSREIAGALDILIAQEKYDQVAEIFPRWVEAAHREIAQAPADSKTSARLARGVFTDPLGQSMNVLTRWMGILGPEEEHAKILEILDTSLDLASDANARRRADNNRRGRSTNVARAQYGNTIYSLWYGKESIRARFDFPRPNQYVSSTQLMLLRQAYEIFQRNNVVEDLQAHLEKRLEESPDDDQVVHMLQLADVSWWLDEKDVALVLLKQVAEQLNEDADLRLEIALLYQAMGDFDGALEIVESIVPRDQQLVQVREMLALDLAERLGDIDRARLSAERLFGLRLDNDTQMQLVERMRRLGLNEMGEAILARMQRRAGNTTQSMGSLMVLYQGQGKTDLAQQLAHTILRRTSSAVASQAAARRNPFRITMSSADSPYRAQALRLLQQTGALDTLIERTVDQIQRSPGTPRLYEELIEYYEVTNDSAKIQDLLRHALEQQPTAVALRYRLAKHLQTAGKLSEACDQYLEILKQRPQWIADDLYEIRRTFTQAGRSLDIFEALEQIDLKQFGQPYYLVDLISEMLQNRSSSVDNEQLDRAINLLEKVSDAFPEYRNQVYSQLYRPELWKNPRIFELAKKALLPSASEMAANPWFGVGQIYSYGSNGRVTSQFSMLLSGIEQSSRVAELQEVIAERLKELPGWSGGAAMLALIEMKSDPDSGRERLRLLIDNEQVLSSIPAEACWIIGQELDAAPQSHAMATKLFETALLRGNSMRQIQYTPLARLLTMYGEAGRIDDARKAISVALAHAESEYSRSPYSSYVDIENSVWAASQFLKLNCPVDAIRIYRKLAEQQQDVELAGQNQRGDADYFKRMIESGMRDALASITVANAAEAAAQLLATTEPAQGKPAIDLMLSVPEAGKIRSADVKSALVDLLIQVTSEASIAELIDQRIEQLHGQFPDDLSVSVVRAAYRIHVDPSAAADEVEALRAFVDQHPLEPIRAGRRPNSRQRRDALNQVALWVVARKCLESDELHDAGMALGRRALDAAQRQTDMRYAATILYQWGNLAITRGDRAEAEAKWSQLLDVITRRPGSTAPAGAESGARVRLPADAQFVAFQPPQQHEADTARRVAPLTIAQFRLATELAIAAAENGMPELSRRAVKEALRGGLPVPDLAKSAELQQVIIRSRRSIPPPGLDDGNMEVEVAAAIRGILDRWQGDAYPAQDTYQLLLPIVFPDNRPGEIFMYADNSKLQDARVYSLGNALVTAANSAKRLDDLVQRIEARQQQAAAKTPALVMRVLVALIAGRPEDAKPPLQELGQLVNTGLPQDVQLACHAALPAADHRELRDPAYAILKAATHLELQSGVSQRGYNSVSLGRLVTMVNRHLADKPEEVQQYFEQFLAGRQQYYGSYSGTYGQYLQWRDWASIAEEAAKSGLPALALDFLGRVVDFSYEGYERPTTTTALAVVCRELSAQSAEQRYTTWSNWTLPTDNRKTVRLVAEWIEPIRVPAAFLTSANTQGQLPAGNFVSNITELIASARACGRLDEVRDRAHSAFEAQLPNADVLYALTLVHLGDAETATQVIEPMFAKIGDRLQQLPNQPRPSGWGEYLVYQACLQSPMFAQRCQEYKPALLHALRTIGAMPLIVRLESDYAASAALKPAPDIRPGDDPQFAHWLPGGTSQSQTGVQPWWVEQEGHLAHLAGSGNDVLYFAYPVTGEFEFTVDAYFGSWAEANVGYGGLIVEAQTGGNASVHSAVGHESITRPPALRPDWDTFAAMTIKVAGDKVQYSLNRHLVYEEPLSGTSPWIALTTAAARPTTFRNPRFTGQPIIPREVQLIAGDRMDGWNTSFFSESQPRHRLMAQKPKDENDYLAYLQRQEPMEFDWWAKEGVLLGRTESYATDSQSWAFYHRPLRDQETFSYEFYYVPGNSVAHPTIGRVALLLEPQGVAEHWISRTDWDEAVVGLHADNRITVPQARRANGVLGLKPTEWNRVAMTLDNQTIRLTLNDELIYERVLDSEIDHRFGLFRMKSQAVQVRQAKLSGPWPESLTADIRQDLVTSDKQYSVADRHLINSILGERMFVRDVARVMEEARTLPPHEAYSRLRSWVLPSVDHPQPRLYSEFVVEEKSGTQSLACPAWELIVAADGAGTLEQLKADIESIDAGHPQNSRSKSALQALVAMHEGDMSSGKRHLAALLEHVSSGLARELSAAERSPELVAAWHAATHDQLRVAAYDLTKELRDRQRHGDFSAHDSKWGACVDSLAGHVYRALLRESPNMDASNLTQWATVPYYKPDIRARGLTHSQWVYQPGAVQHVPGGTWGQLFFQSPLRGNFEITAQRGLHNWREMAIAYGMHSAEPRYDWKAKRIIKLMHASNDVDREIAIPNQGAWAADFRIVVAGDTITTFVNDVEIHQESLGRTPDPWLVLQASGPGWDSTVRNLRITGNPEIPEEINLIDIAGWASWRADYYGEWFSEAADGSGTTAPWQRVDDEIRGELRDNVSADPLPSLLMYQRPMLEDGVIEFEAFYQPGEFEVYPAVGRTALIIRAGEIGKHVLTGAQFDTSTLAPDNFRVLQPAGEQMPLKANEWNHYRLTLTGDELSLSINDSAVATVTLSEPRNERYFGLFRYANKTRSRVRKLVYRGNWPKSLPPVEEQQLARSGDGGELANWTSAYNFDLRLDNEQLAAAGLNATGGPEDITKVSQGTRLVKAKNERWPQLEFAEPISGDFSATLEFENLQLAKAAEGWGNILSFKTFLDDGVDTWVEAGVGMNLEGQRILKSAWVHKNPGGQEKYEDRVLFSSATSGRLRIVRSGSLILTYYAQADSDNFQLLEMWPAGTGPVKSIVVQCASSDTTASVDVVVSRLHIQVPAAASPAPETK